MYAVIPAGGAGTRLWPRSRRAAPKHSLPLGGTGRSLLEETYDRVRGVADEVFILTEASQTAMIKRLLPDLDDRQLIVEPAARGTTSALGLAALTLLEIDPEGVMASLPADHVIHGTDEFHQALRQAVMAASISDCLVTIGLRPLYPATWLGYIRTSGPAAMGAPVEQVAQFVEKPDLAQATELVASTHSYWNLAMFCWRLSVFADQLRIHSPEHYSGLQSVIEARRNGDEALATELYLRLPVDAIDYAVMEKTDQLLLVPAGFDWRDVGSWAELQESLEQDGDGNVIEGESVLIDTHSCLILAPGKLVAAIGVSDLVVVETDDAVLICHRDRAQDVKRVVEELSRTGKIKYL